MPTTYKNLYPHIYAFDNLYQAHRQARKGGKRRRPEVADFEHNLGENLLCLGDELRDDAPAGPVGDWSNRPAGAIMD